MLSQSDVVQGSREDHVTPFKAVLEPSVGCGKTAAMARLVVPPTSVSSHSLPGLPTLRSSLAQGKKGVCYCKLSSRLQYGCRRGCDNVKDERPDSDHAYFPCVKTM